MAEFPSLNEILAYRNPTITERFSRKYPELKNQADTLLTELLKFLWLFKKHSVDQRKFPEDKTLQFKFLMHNEMVLMDEMWHEFIIVTKDYTHFCQHYFGEYLHHIPEALQKPEFNPHKNTEHEIAIFEKELQLYLSYVYDHLGEKTMRHWFSVYFTDATM